MPFVSIYLTTDNPSRVDIIKEDRSGSKEKADTFNHKPNRTVSDKKTDKDDKK
jgi:hypothetical protein